jgi:uncharacterized membrane protein HdeD (DUF308 family)
LNLKKGGKILMPAITFPALGLWMGIASLIFGVIVMIFPKILNYLVGIYLIIIGIMAIIAYLR